jgi:antitoxin (DNA-binding transcriptional repressor) of toxin-antitoxin stability system
MQMTTKTVDIDATDNKLSDLLTLAMQGTEVIFSRDDTPLAKLVLVQSETNPKRKAGLHEGAITMSDDFDDPLPEEFWLGSS